MDFWYSDPMPEVIRFEDVKFRGYPHDPQLKRKDLKKKLVSISAIIARKLWHVS